MLDDMLSQQQLLTATIPVPSLFTDIIRNDFLTEQKINEFLFAPAMCIAESFINNLVACSRKQFEARWYFSCAQCQCQHATRRVAACVSLRGVS